jgi:hypothetical protein
MKKVLSESIVTHHGSLPDQDSDGEEKSDSTFSEEATYGDIRKVEKFELVSIKQNTQEIKNNLTENNIF